MTGRLNGEHHFNPIDYGFEWVDDWYRWDHVEAHKQARADRDALARKMKAKGVHFKKSTSRNQLMSRGGIGSGHPHIEEVVTVYTLLIYD